MSGATFSRLKNWTTEVLTPADLNAEIDNILTNLGPSGVDNYSHTVTEMRLTTDAGEVGTESQATALSGELERLRFALKEIKGSGAAQWYSSVSTSLTDLNTLIGTSQLNNRIVSGTSSTASSAMRFLIPSGTTAAVTIDGAPTALVYNINGTAYSITADTTLSGLATASASNNTAAVNDAFLTSQERSKWIGEDGTVLQMTAAGTEITNLSGKIAAFKIVQGGNTEYFLGTVKSSTQISNVRRGFFYDSTGVSKNRIAISNGATITLLKLTWVFATTASSAAVTYTNPSFSYAQPSGPSTGDYWFDMSTNVWKTFNSVAWATASATLVGVCAQDTANCVAARAFDTYTNVINESNIAVDYVSASQIQVRNNFGYAYVRANKVRFETTRPVWDITANLDTGITESASTTYFAYLSEAGKVVLSNEKPYRDFGVLVGHYHPYETWKAIGCVENDSASDFATGTILTYNYGADFAPNSSTELANCFVTASVGSNALTISMKHPHNPMYVGFRNETATSGVFYRRRIESVPAVKVGQGSTLGLPSNTQTQVFAYLIDTGAGIEMGASAGWFDDGGLITTVAGASSATADSGGVLYTETAFTSKAIRLLARIISTQTNAGTWATAPSALTLTPFAPLSSASDNLAYISATSSGAFNTAGTYGDLINNFILPPGVWDIDAQLRSLNNGGATGTPITLGLSTFSGDDGTGLTAGDNALIAANATANGAGTSLTITNYRVNLTVATTYLMKYRVDGSNVNITANGRMSARRVFRGI